MSKYQFILASDVRNPLYGKKGAAFTFAPQKGATPNMVEELEKRAQCFAKLSAQYLEKDLSSKPGAGAAGGLGYAFIQYLNAAVQSGADLLLDLTNFDNLLKDANLVITGEGHADRQTLMGKLPERVMQRTQKHQIPVWLIAGQTDDAEKLIEAGFKRVDKLIPEGMDLQEAIKPEITRQNIAYWVNRNF